MEIMNTVFERAGNGPRNWSARGVRLSRAFGGEERSRRALPAEMKCFQPKTAVNP